MKKRLLHIFVISQIFTGQVRMKENFFNTNSACLARAMATCKKVASCNFNLNTWRQIKFQRNRSDKKAKLPDIW